MRPTPEGFEQRLLSRARRAQLAAGDRLVVGFSGGRDSLALAAALRRVEAVLDVRLTLVHVDHRQRPSSAEDAKWAAELASALGFALRVCTLAEPPPETHPGVGIEEAARRERYRILFAEAIALGARAVATAHHQGDQAETVLLHLLRGGGVHGAAAMAEWAPIPIHDISQEKQIAVWRPLLHESRAEIDDYIAQFGLTPIDDPSNEDILLRRNALRHEILPSLEARFPGAGAALARYAALAAEDDRLLDELAANALAETVDPGGRLIVARLVAQPLALQRRIVRRWLWQVTGSATFSAERTDATLDMARSSGGRSIEIGEGWTVRRERGMLRVERLESQLQGREG